MLLFINISGRLVLINASIIIKRRKNKQIKIESMTAFVFISGIHRTNGSDNEQLFGKSHSLFAAPKALQCALFVLSTFLYFLFIFLFTAVTHCGCACDISSYKLIGLRI